MATTRDLMPITPITDSAKFEQMDRLVYEVVREKTPLLTLFQHLPSVNTMFKFTEKKRRNTGTTLAAAIDDASTTVMSLTLSQFAAIGDVVEVGDELLLVTAVGSSGISCTTVRARQGTTAATHAIATSVFLAGNARYYGATLTAGTLQKKALVTGFMQDFDKLVDIPFGEIEEAQPLVPGAGNSFLEAKMEALADCKQDMEMALVRNYAATVPTSASGPAFSMGLKGRLTSALGASVTTLDSDGELSRQVFNGMMEKISTKGDPSGPFIALSGSVAFQAPAEWIRVMQWAIGLNPSGAVGAKSEAYQAPMGSQVKLVHEPVLDRYSTDTMYILNTRYVKLRPSGKGRDWIKWHDVAQERKTKKAGFWRGRVGLQIECPWAHGMIQGIKEVV